MRSAVSFVCCISLQIYGTGSLHDCHCSLAVVRIMQDCPCQLVASQTDLGFDLGKVLWHGKRVNLLKLRLLQVCSWGAVFFWHIGSAVWGQRGVYVLGVQMSNEECRDTCQPITGRTHSCNISVSPLFRLSTSDILPLKMEPPLCSETSGTNNPLARRHIPEEWET